MMHDPEMVEAKRASCTCERCVKMCQSRPCWGTPEDMKAIIDAGLGDRLMVDMDGYYDSNGFAEVGPRVLCPGAVGHEGSDNDMLHVSSGWGDRYPSNPCTFLKDGLCELHALGLKPTEGRRVTCVHGDTSWHGVHDEMENAWKTAEGSDLVEKWSEGR
jgi:hypothetical protein